ncbi:MAG: creatininase family protein [Phycisphaeraceae bacterium]|nr:creatininase family protein [Phycisphaeraceae bacterium]
MSGPRDYVLNEANLQQVRRLAPNLAVLPWGACEGHNYHLPHGTDNYEATALGEAAVARANAAGAKCLLLPTIPFGNNNQQLDQAATITMRGITQQAVLSDVALSLVRQNIERLVVLNFHGGNNFVSSIRDVMLEHPIYIVLVNAFQLAPEARKLLDHPDGDHADEFETSLMLHLHGELVQMGNAGDGAAEPFKLKSLRGPGVWSPRVWSAVSKDTGIGDPRKATAQKGGKVFQLLVAALTPVLIEFSGAKPGDLPFVIQKRP